MFRTLWEPEMYSGFLENDQFNPSCSDSAGRALKKPFSNRNRSWRLIRLDMIEKLWHFSQMPSLLKISILLLLYYVLCWSILRLFLWKFLENSRMYKGLKLFNTVYGIRLSKKNTEAKWIICLLLFFIVIWSLDHNNVHLVFICFFIFIINIPYLWMSRVDIFDLFERQQVTKNAHSFSPVSQNNSPPAISNLNKKAICIASLLTFIATLKNQGDEAVNRIIVSARLFSACCGNLNAGIESVNPS